MSVTGYAVHVMTQLQDGHEDYWKAFHTLDQAIAYINEHSDPWGATNSFELFELGQQIKLECSKEVVQEPPPEPKSKYVYRVVNAKETATNLRRGKKPL